MRRTFAGLAAVVFYASLTAATHAQGACPLTGTSGGESISAQITVDGTGAPVTDGTVVPSGTKLRIDALATAYGQCDNNCGQIYNRTVNHINVWADITTNGSLNGRYSVGYIVGVSPNGTTAHYNVLDTRAANSTGPVYETVFSPGTYKYQFQAALLHK